VLEDAIGLIRRVCGGYNALKRMMDFIAKADLVHRFTHELGIPLMTDGGTAQGEDSQAQMALISKNHLTSRFPPSISSRMPVQELERPSRTSTREPPSENLSHCNVPRDYQSLALRDI
jgi:hypothetical protein